MFLKLVALEGLLVFNLLFRVFIGLQNQVMLLLALLQVLVHFVFELLAERVHFVLLLLHKFGLSCKNLFVAIFHVLLTLLCLNFIGALLHLVGFLVVLLLGEVSLNLAHVEQLGRLLERQRECLFQFSSVVLQLLGVPHLEFFDLLLVFFLRFREHLVVMLIKLLVLLNVSLLDFFLALLVREDELLVLHVEFLLFEFEDTVLSHFSLWK